MIDRDVSVARRIEEIVGGNSLVCGRQQSPRGGKRGHRRWGGRHGVRFAQRCLAGLGRQPFVVQQETGARHYRGQHQIELDQFASQNVANPFLVSGISLRVTGAATISRTMTFFFLSFP